MMILIMQTNKVKMADNIMRILNLAESRLFSLYCHVNKPRIGWFVIFSQVFVHIQLLVIFFNAQVALKDSKVLEE
jgi:hypothetical protein